MEDTTLAILRCSVAERPSLEGRTNANPGLIWINVRCVLRGPPLRAGHLSMAAGVFSARVGRPDVGEVPPSSPLVGVDSETWLREAKRSRAW
jgi:hypothetical protein